MVTESAGKSFETQMENLGKEIAEEMGIPTWALVAILIGNSKCLQVFYCCQAIIFTNQIVSSLNTDMLTGMHFREQIGRAHV